MFRSLRQRILAGAYDAVMRGYQRYMHQRKAQLFADVPNDVVEIGPGTGANLEFLPAGTHWTGVEPNPYMHSRIAANAKKRNIAVQFVASDGGWIDLPDESADAVVCSLVLCSVPDAAATLAEVRRILRPGGRFLFIEHVAAPEGTRLRRVQSLLSPCWSVLADGCRLNRDTAKTIESAGFSDVQLEAFRVPVPPALPIVSPHIAGVGVK